MPEILRNPSTLLIATRNPGKYREALAHLSDLPIRLVDGSQLPEVEETGLTFEENARLKAIAASIHSESIALADDSGLEVDALGGDPGVYSARFGWPGVVTPAGRNALLLARLDGVPWEGRTARFRCAIAVAEPNRRVYVRQASCEGFIGFTPKGTDGFGYDPLFFLPTRGCTMAELPLEEKNVISHRGQALEAIRPVLQELFGLSIAPMELESGPRTKQRRRV